MSEVSLIEWTHATWNFVLGCEKCSAGCAGCYATADAVRLAKNPNPRTAAPYRGLAYRQDNGISNWTGEVRLIPERLVLPFASRRPRRIFVNSLSDLFHPAVPDAFVRRAVGVMAAMPWHAFQVLTKRAARLEELSPSISWPANVWVGVSVEDQAAAGRIDHLRRTQAAVKFVSAEPLLGPVELDLAGIDWVITGGESGPRARPFDARWALAVRDQCRAAGAAFFHKQNGSHLAGDRPRSKKANGRRLYGRLYDGMPLLPAVPVPPPAERRALARRLVPEACAGARLTLPMA